MSVSTATLVGKAVHWALPRLGFYALAAVTGMVAFFAWAAFYVYVWPGTPKAAAQPPPPAHREFVPNKAKSRQQETTKPIEPAIVMIQPNKDVLASVTDPYAPPSVSQWKEDNLLGIEIVDFKHVVIGRIQSISTQDREVTLSLTVSALPGRLTFPIEVITWNGQERLARKYSIFYS